MLVVAEAGWGSIFVSALYNGPRRPSVDLPFLAFAIPAAGGVVLSAWGRQRVGPWWRARPWTQLRARQPLDPWRKRVFRMPWWWRSEMILLAPAFVVVMAITAGLISELTIGGSFFRVATHPWATVGHHPAVVAGAAWVVSILCWVRGYWLGRYTLTARHALLSLGLSGAVFIGIFAGRAAKPNPQFMAATGPAGWLFFVSFPFTAAVIALVHQRDLERQVLNRASSRPSGPWVAVLAAPMAAVGLIALLVAALIGPAAPAVGRAAAFVVTNIADGVKAAALWIWGLFPGGNHAKLPNIGTALRKGANGKVTKIPQHATIHVPPAVGIALISIVVLVVAIYLLSHIHISRASRPTADVGAVESSSLFSWRHLFGQLRHALARLFDPSRFDLRRRRASRRPLVPASGAAGFGGRSAPSTVREIYRSVLVACREVGAPRRDAETGRELAQRVSGGLDLPSNATDRLQHLTRLYEGVRYGSDADAEADQAAEDAGVVIPALRAQALQAAGVDGQGSAAGHGGGGNSRNASVGSLRNANGGNA